MKVHFDADMRSVLSRLAGKVLPNEPTALAFTPDMRDTEKNPYSPDEARVAKYLNELAGIGGGDDPIGFLISSHAALSDRVKNYWGADPA